MSMNTESTELVFAEDCVSEGLFKFRPYETDTDIERVRMLLSGQLYFSTCLQMNDPFEMRARLSLEKNTRLRRQRLKKTLIKIQSRQGISKKDQLKLVNQQISKLEKDPEARLRRVEQKANERMQSECVVFCVSATRRHPLLWSHYADSHRGLCIRFDHTLEPFRSSNRVTYTKKYPEVVYPFVDEFSSDLLEKTVLTKAEYWKYEEEFRLWSIRMGNPKWHWGRTWLDERRVQINSSAIKGVTFGARMSPSKRRDVIEHCRKVCPHVEFDEAIVSDDRYELEFDQIGDSV